MSDIEIPIPPANHAHKLDLNETLLAAVMDGTIYGLEMTTIKPVPVGASRFSRASLPYSVIVGMVGKNSGSMSLSLGTRAVLLLAGRLLGTEIKELDDDCFDAVMEIGNMVAGRIKTVLIGTDYAISAISLPSLVLGGNYSVHYARGVHTVTCEFEIPEIAPIHFQERFFSTTISLMRGSGV
jgi:chemotaxis protein CheX